MQIYAMASGPNAPDQYVGIGKIPTVGPTTDATWFNQSFTTPDTCIYVEAPALGEYLYMLDSYDNLTISYKTQVLFDSPKTCAFSTVTAEQPAAAREKMMTDSVNRFVEDIKRW